MRRHRDAKGKGPVVEHVDCEKHAGADGPFAERDGGGLEKGGAVVLLLLLLLLLVVMVVVMVVVCKKG